MINAHTSRISLISLALSTMDYRKNSTNLYKSQLVTIWPSWVESVPRKCPIGQFKVKKNKKIQNSLVAIKSKIPLKMAAQEFHDDYWEKRIKPLITENKDSIEFVGELNDTTKKYGLL